MNNVLIQCGDHLENQLRILPLAKWLKAQGYNPVVMVYRKFNGTSFLKNNIDVISLDIKARSKTVKNYSIKRNASDLIVNEVSFSKVMQAEFNKQPYLTLPKYKIKNEKKFVDNTLAITDVINRVKPDYIFVWNGYTGVVANFLRVYCSQYDIPCSFLERGFKKDSLYIDSQGVNGFGLLSDKGPYCNATTYNVDLKDVKTVLVPLQVQTDTNIIYNSDIKTMREFVFYVREKFDNDVVLYVKTHPEEVDKNLNLPILDNVVYLNQCDLNHYIKNVDLVVTINSTVGMTAIFEGTPVVSLGKSIYSNKNLAITKKQFESNECFFELDFPSLFKEDLEKNFTFSVVTLDFMGEVFKKISSKGGVSSFNSFGISLDEYSKSYEVFCSKIISLSEYERLCVDVYFSVDNGLDLTYRNTNVEVTKDWIISRFRSLGVKAKIFLSQGQNVARLNSVKVAMVHTTKINKTKFPTRYDFIVNEYGDVVFVEKDSKMNRFFKLGGKLSVGAFDGKN